MTCSCLASQSAGALRVCVCVCLCVSVRGAEGVPGGVNTPAAAADHPASTRVSEPDAPPERFKRYESI